VIMVLLMVSFKRLLIYKTGIRKTNNDASDKKLRSWAPNL